MENQILDASNNTLSVTNLFASNNPTTALGAPPLGAVGDSATGEVGLKVIPVGTAATANTAIGTTTDAPVADNTTVTSATAATGIALWKRIINLIIASNTSSDKVIPATTAAAVTPSDATALTSRAIWVGGAGDLSVRLSGATSTTVVFTAVPAGSLLPISVVRVMAATTATNINVLN